MNIFLPWLNNFLNHSKLSWIRCLLFYTKKVQIDASLKYWIRRVIRRNILFAVITTNTIKYLSNQNLHLKYAILKSIHWMNNFIAFWLVCVKHRAVNKSNKKRPRLCSQYDAKPCLFCINKQNSWNCVSNSIVQFGYIQKCVLYVGNFVTFCFLRIFVSNNSGDNFYSHFMSVVSVEQTLKYYTIKSIRLFLFLKWQSPQNLFQAKLIWKFIVKINVTSMW